MVGNVDHPRFHRLAVAPAVPAVEPSAVLIRQRPVGDGESAAKLGSSPREFELELLAIDKKVVRDPGAELRTLILVAPVPRDQGSDLRGDQPLWGLESPWHPVVIVLVKGPGTEQGDQEVRRWLLLPGRGSRDPQGKLWKPEVAPRVRPSHAPHPKCTRMVWCPRGGVALRPEEGPLQVRHVCDPPPPPPPERRHPPADLWTAGLACGAAEGRRGVEVAPDELRAGFWVRFATCDESHQHMIPGRAVGVKISRAFQGHVEGDLGRSGQVSFVDIHGGHDVAVQQLVSFEDGNHRSQSCSGQPGLVVEVLGSPSQAREPRPHWPPNLPQVACRVDREGPPPRGLLGEHELQGGGGIPVEALGDEGAAPAVHHGRRDGDWDVALRPRAGDLDEGRRWIRVEDGGGRPRALRIGEHRGESAPP
mmetsp:Transcript_5184/g.18169  ORF Transcript_5184/g.18169 Transcript_5184/m.18169 type:complete len:420 (-) Transcript_5184:738-1997(-)